MIALSEIAATLESLPNVLRAMLTPIDDEALRTRPEPGEWCVLEVIGHLIATDSGAFRDRIAAIVSGEPEIGGFDPWEAINNRNFADEPLEGLLEELAGQRSELARFLDSLVPSDLAKTANYRDHGSFAAGDFVHEWPFHDQDHLQQILDILKLNYLRHMTDIMRTALTAEAD